MYEKSQNKIIITKETIEKELSKKSGFIPFFTGFYVLIAIFFSMVFGFVYFAGVKGHDLSLLEQILWYALLSFCYGTLVISYLYIVGAALLRRKKLKNGNFLVITDEVYSKEEKEVRRRRFIVTKRFVHFSKCGKVEFSNKTWFDLTSRGDTYYIVVHSSDTTDPYLYYPTKLYEYKE